MKKDLITGCMTAMITPFNNGEVDYESLEKIISLQVENKVNILVCGTTAETATFKDDEYEKVIEFVVKKVDHKVNVVAGCGSNNTSKAIENAKLCEKLGVDGLLVVTPYYNKTTQRGLYEHYKAIANSTKLPIILYNVPGRTGLDIKSETACKLSKIDNIVGIKEASGDIVKAEEIVAGSSDDFYLYSGNDDIVVPLMSVGGKGVISVLSNLVPDVVKKMTDSFENGDVKTARDIQLKYLKFIQLLFKQTNPIPAKQAAYFMGLCKSPEVRLPLCEMTEEEKAALYEEMKNLELII